jgi:hypothetical protein
MNDKIRDKAVDGKRQADQALLQIFSWIQADFQPKRSEIYSLLDPLSTESKLFMMAKTSQMATRRYISLYFTQLKDTSLCSKGGFDSNGNQARPLHPEDPGRFAQGSAR